MLVLLTEGGNVELTNWEGKTYDQMHEPTLKPYSLPILPYEGGYRGLEPVIDERTLKVHHTGHHKTYTDNMNSLLSSWRGSGNHGELAHSSLLDILMNVSAVPENWKTGIINNVGGFVNHNLYWAVMCNDPGSNQPEEPLLGKLQETFGTFEGFKDHFTYASLSVFGSGYVWLVEDGNGNLQIIKTKNQDSPLSMGLYPLLVVDLWEHAYYLKHQNKRKQYLEEWWRVVCWREVVMLQRYWRALRGEELSQAHTEL